MVILKPGDGFRAGVEKNNRREALMKGLRDGDGGIVRIFVIIVPEDSGDACLSA